MTTIYRRVKKKHTLEEEMNLLRTIRIDNNNIQVIQQGSSSYLHPQTSNGLSIYCACIHSTNMIHFNAFHTEENICNALAIHKTHNPKQIYQCFKCYKRTLLKLENYTVVLNSKNVSSVHQLCPSIKMNIKPIAFDGTEYLLPEIPLILNEINSESLWELCGMVFMIRVSSIILSNKS